VVPSLSGVSWGLREDTRVKPRRTTALAPLLVWAAWVRAAGCVASFQAELLTGGKLLGGHQQLPVLSETGRSLYGSFWGSDCVGSHGWVGSRGSWWAFVSLTC